MAKLEIGQWSKDYDKCVNCELTENRYEAHGLCRRCHGKLKERDKDRRYRELNREKIRERAKKYKYKSKYRSREGRPSSCEICARNGRIVFDHDHATGKFRGWICNQCNVSLGMVRDNIDVLQKMIAYLVKSR